MKKRTGPKAIDELRATPLPTISPMDDPGLAHYSDDQVHQIQRLLFTFVICDLQSHVQVLIQMRVCVNKAIFKESMKF